MSSVVQSYTSYMVTFMFIGSAVGTIGNIGQTVYGASKAGLVGFTRSLAKEVASRGITANVVSPGITKSSVFSCDFNPYSAIL